MFHPSSNTWLRLLIFANTNCLVVCSLDSTSRRQIADSLLTQTPPQSVMLLALVVVVVVVAATIAPRARHFDCYQCMVLESIVPICRRKELPHSVQVSQNHLPSMYIVPRVHKTPFRKFRRWWPRVFVAAPMRPTVQ